VVDLDGEKEGEIFCWLAVYKIQLSYSMQFFSKKDVCTLLHKCVFTKKERCVLCT
jgi:hypothetical protein